MSRFPFEFAGWVRLPMLVIGATRSNTYAELSDDALTIRMGWYHVTIPRDEIAGAEPTRWSMLGGLGVRITREVIAYVASTRGAVRVNLTRKRTFRVLLNLTVERDAVVLALKDPEGFAAAL